MIKKPRFWCFLLFSLCLIHSQVADGQLIANVDVIVTEEDGLFTFEYTVTNSILSGGPINAFLLSVAKGTDVVEPEGFTVPDGWVGDYDPFLLDRVSLASDFQVGAAAGDGLNCANESHDLLEGLEAKFTVTSRYSPAEQQVLLAKVVDDRPIDEGGSGPCGIFSRDPIIQPIAAPSIPPGPSCDFDGNGECDIVDIDALGLTIANGIDVTEFDLTGDSLVNLDDLDAFLRHEKVNRFNGDATFNGTVGFEDFLVLSNNFGKDDIAWSGGNFRPDDITVDFPDFLILADNFGRSAQANMASIPEPTGLMLTVVALCSLVGRCRKGRP